ncbi:hypothetical protein AB4Z52_35335 [Rhizobium sp. 2YAF20]|uniref:hypothetical protein n=1 Tax=Rhizobium sp. 2YAF20 TaxID=3233027 RepID=UPI003F9AF4C3
MFKAACVSASVVICMTGCASTPTEVAKPTDITLGEAVNQVATSLHSLQNEYKDQPKVGLMADSATVTFVVAASSTNTRGATLNVAAPLTAGNLTAGLSDSLVSNGNRGNTVVIQFKNIMTADLSKGGYSYFRAAEKPRPSPPVKTSSATPTKDGKEPIVIVPPSGAAGKSMQDLCNVVPGCLTKGGPGQPAVM